MRNLPKVNSQNQGTLQCKHQIVLSMGIGRLHFVQAIEALTAVGIEVKAIQGWVPGKLIGPRFLDISGRMIGKPNLSKNLEKRQMHFLEQKNNISIAAPEFLEQAQRLLRPKTRAKGIVQSISWKLFGRLSCKHIAGASIMHVRSGAGAGGCIDKARSKGAKILVDHSIAHIDFLSETFGELPADNYTRIWMNKKNLFWRQVMKDCASADQIVVNSDFVKQTFTDAGFSEDKISVVYLGVRTDFISLKTSYESKGALRLLFTGTFGWRKGADFLLDALCRLDGEGQDFVLRVVGSVEEGFLTDKRVKKLGKKVVFTGHVPQDELKLHMKWADLYVFPTLAEGCASSGMEALAAGLPVVTTAESGLPIKHLETGYVVARKDSNAIHDAVLTLISDISLRERLGIEGAKLIKNNYSWENYAENMITVYKSLLTRNPST